MTKNKEKDIKQLFKILLCLDEKSLLIMKSNAEVLKTRDSLDNKKVG